jgi:hypothetical protein
MVYQEKSGYNAGVEIANSEVVRLAPGWDKSEPFLIQALIVFAKRSSSSSVEQRTENKTRFLF